MKKYYKYLSLCLFFIVIFFLSPLSGDDWGNYIVGSEGLRHSLGVAVGLYFDWEGRFISRVLINILTYYKWLWNIINALVVTATIYIGMKFVGKKTKKFIFPLMSAVLLLMNLYTFSQTMVWVAGNITYLFIVPVLLWYFYYLLNNDKYNKWFTFIFILINLFGTMFVENMALVLVGGNILLLLYKYIKTKKIDRRLVVYTIISIGSILVMLLSPGTRYRNTIENVVFNELSLFGKMIFNIPNFVYYTFIINTYLLVLMSYSNYLIIRNKIDNKYLKFFLLIFMLVLPLLTIFIYPISVFMDTDLFLLIDTNNLFVIVYWLVYLVISFILVFLHDRKELKLVFLFLVGLISNVVMLVSPTWGFRTSLFTYIVLAIVALNIINNYSKDNKFFDYVSYGILVGATIFYLIFYINICRCQSNLEKGIEKQLIEESEVIYIDRFPSFANCNINPENEYHIGKYKLYYGIPEDKELVLIDGKWKYLIFYSN